MRFDFRCFVVGLILGILMAFAQTASAQESRGTWTWQCNDQSCQRVFVPAQSQSQVVQQAVRHDVQQVVQEVVQFGQTSEPPLTSGNCQGYEGQRQGPIRWALGKIFRK